MSKHHKRLPEHTPDRVRDFIRHMLAGKPAREAAKLAGFEPTQAGALCGRPEVRAALQRERTAKDQVLRHTPAGIEGQMGALAFADFAEMFNPDGSLKPIHEIDPATRAAIAGFEMHSIDGPNGMVHKVTKIKFAPRQPVLRDLAAIHGLLGPEQLRTTINAPAFVINIDLGGAAEEALDKAADAAAVEVPFRRVAEQPPPGTYNRGSTWRADQPEPESEPERIAREKYEAQRAHKQRDGTTCDPRSAAAYEESQRRAIEALSRKPRQGFANGLD